MHELGAVGHLFPTAAGEVIEYRHGGAGCHQLVGHVGADESGAAGQQDIGHVGDASKRKSFTVMDMREE